MPEYMSVKIDADQFERAIKNLPRYFNREVLGAGAKVAKMVLETEGVKKYPPLTTQKRDEGVGSSWYERGRGSAYHSVNGVQYSNNSEKYGTRWTQFVNQRGVRLRNSASYGVYLGGHKQANRMRKFGWKKITSVIKSKMERIKNIYRGAIRKAVKQAGFRMR